MSSTLSPFPICVGVPHRFPPYLLAPEEYTHDLSDVVEVCGVRDAIVWLDGEIAGGPARMRHQYVKASVLVEETLIERLGARLDTPAEQQAALCRFLYGEPGEWPMQAWVRVVREVSKSLTVEEQEDGGLFCDLLADLGEDVRAAWRAVSEEFCHSVWLNI